MSIELQIGLRIKFSAIDDFTGQEYEEIGKIIANSKSIDPALLKVIQSEIESLEDDNCLVRVDTVNGSKLHLVNASEIISVED